MTFALRLPKFKHRRQSSSAQSTMQASKSSNCVALDSHNPTTNIFYMSGTQNINYSTSPGNKSPSVGGTVQTAEVTETTKALPTSKYQMLDEILEVQSRRTRSENSMPGMSSIVEEESINTPLSTPKPDKKTFYDHSQNNFSRTIRVLDPKELVEAMPRMHRDLAIEEDSLSRRSLGSARTSRYSTDGCTYELSKLSLENIRFSEPVEKHVKTYMTSQKKNFANPKTAICLWDPFSSIDFNNDVQEKHCILGDVGKFNSSGGFDVMFNIFMTMEENRKMHYFPPTTFTPFHLPPTETQWWYLRPGEESPFFITYDLERCDQGRTSYQSYGFRSIKDPKSPGSAILVAPGSSKKEIRRSLIPHIRQYLADQVKSWYDPSSYPNEQHENLSGGSLNLICTCYKSKIWAAAALPQSSRQKKEQIEARLSRNLDTADAYQWDVHSSFKVNHGSSKRDVRKIEYTVAVEVYPLGLPTSASTVDGILSSLHLTKLFSSAFSLRSNHGNSPLQARFLSFRSGFRG